MARLKASKKIETGNASPLVRAKWKKHGSESTRYRRSKSSEIPTFYPPRGPKNKKGANAFKAAGEQLGTNRGRGGGKESRTSSASGGGAGRWIPAKTTLVHHPPRRGEEARTTRNQGLLPGGDARSGGRGK